ncbi:hypothetical protein [Aridibaculum aurantiacum]|uniref:hypothetical protein n=1 Tax=Aridibaculum aurantiacum TaxID=2810307 RepID=UPI001A979618|nr:hypothetical protein [Aridibaculum aurantiacum]
MSTAIAPKKTYELFAILCLLPALYIQLRWMMVFYSSGNLSPAARTSTFLDQFPGFLANARLLAFVCLAFSIAAIAFAQRSFNQPKTFWRVSSFIVVFIAAIIAFLSIFQML